jgi:aquaporin Z
MINALKNHWPEYLIEAWCLGTFMVSACFFGVLLFSRASPLAELDMVFRSSLMGVAMGATAIGIIASPWGKLSGAHFNPAVTLTFLRLGKIDLSDAIFYIIFQFIGGTTGVLVSWLVLGDFLASSPVNFVVTLPGKYGEAPAFAAETGMSFVMMMTILVTSNSSRLARFTPLVAATLVAFFIATENPISGMSINPARTFASAVVAESWNGWWIYFIAPPLAMFAAAECFVRLRGLKSVLCAKLDHSGLARCIFKCEFERLLAEGEEETPPKVGIETA